MAFLPRLLATCISTPKDKIQSFIQSYDKKVRKLELFTRDKENEFKTDFGFAADYQPFASNAGFGYTQTLLVAQNVSHVLHQEI